MSGTRIPAVSGDTRNSPPQKPGAAPNSVFPQKALPASQPNQPSPPGITTLKLSLQNQITENPGSLPEQQHIIARELLMQTAESLGFPRDSLSAALLVFARFFSLSPTPALIGQLRREILASGKASSPGTGGEKAAMEAEALASSAAADKGVALSSEAMEHYAGFFVPPASASLDEEENPKNREEVPDPQELQNIAEEEAQKDSLLDLLNCIPGKNGQYWMVFPFTVTIKGTELRVFIRILKRELPDKNEQLIVDISGAKRQWRCFLKKNGEKLRADIQVYPECSPRGLIFLQKEAERFLGGENTLPGNTGFREIFVCNGGEIPSWVEDLSAACLPSISKDV